MARTYARLETPTGEYEFSHAELDQLRMLIGMSLKTDTVPQADPPIRTDQYESLKEFINESFDATRDLDTEEAYLD